MHIILTSLIFNSGYSGKENIPLDLFSEILCLSFLITLNNLSFYVLEKDI